MQKIYKIETLLLIFTLIISIPLFSVDRTLGILKNDSNSFKGYTLFCPMPSKITYLIDNYGRIVHTWESQYDPNLGIYLLENGNLLKSFIRDDESCGVEIISWDGTLLWQYDYYSSEYEQHHDIEPMPNGNVLIIARQYHSKTDAVQAGRDPDFMRLDYLDDEEIIEIKQTGLYTGDIVWKWSAWDHLIQDFDASKDNYGVISDHPELLDINFNNNRADWLHVNAVAYNPTFDQIMISSRSLHEIWIVDHSTTTTQATSHSGGNYNKGGDFLYRWGNPISYGAGDVSDQMYFGQHNAHWIKDGLQGAGDILVFNNGYERPIDGYSTVDEIISPIDENGNYTSITPGVAYAPDNYIWSFVATPPTDITSAHISSAQRLPNGHTLICKGDTGHFFEVTSDKQIVWEYQSPVATTLILNQGDSAPSVGVFTAHEFSEDFQGFSGKDLTPRGYIENNPIHFENTQNDPGSPLSIDEVLIFSKIYNNNGIASVKLYVYYGSDSLIVDMFDDGTHNDTTANDSLFVGTIPQLPENTTVNYYIDAVDGFSNEFLDPPFATKDYNFHYTVKSATPENITIGINLLTLNLSWDVINSGGGYKVYSSDYPDSGFTEDTSGSFNGANWTTSITTARKFYYVSAMSAK